MERGEAPSGNADMHLKNFSLIYQRDMGSVFSPAYDLLPTILVNPDDDEDCEFIELSFLSREMKGAYLKLLGIFFNLYTN